MLLGCSQPDGSQQFTETCDSSNGKRSHRGISVQVYEAFFLMATRNFKAAATLFLEAIATFTTWVARPPIKPLVLHSV
jgi:hypothetical protein